MAIRGQAATPEAEAERRAAISRFARTRFRDALGRYAPKVVEVEVKGWTTRSREPSDSAERRLGWDYHGPQVIRVRSASIDADYINDLLNAKFPERRFWGVDDVLEDE